uniref:Uncharacterized protein n=1 Tax=Knipowitschia caucasica TaxID=637954 RepID=A0AAV2LSN7_KNICA
MARGWTHLRGHRAHHQVHGGEKRQHGASVPVCVCPRMERKIRICKPTEGEAAVAESTLRLSRDACRLLTVLSLSSNPPLVQCTSTRTRTNSHTGARTAV